MTETRTPFRIVMRGYDPIEVDRRVAELTHATTTAQQHASELHSEMDRLKDGRPVAGPIPNRPAAELDFDAIGGYIGGIIKHAHDAVATMRKQAETEVRDMLAQGEAAMEQARQDAEKEVAKRVSASEQQLASARRYVAVTQAKADRVREDAEHKAAELVTAAQGQAEQLLGEARRKAGQLEAESKSALVALTKERDAIVATLTKLWKALPEAAGLVQSSAENEAAD